jgi:hypothetical protein
MRRTLLVMATMSFVVLVIGGVAYAAKVQCEPGITCVGTEKPDRITGTDGHDFINALGGKDTVFGLGGNDQVDGFGGNDVIHGGLDGDGGTSLGETNLEGAERSDKVYGEEGNDIIDASANDTPRSRDRSFGGTGNDEILAIDGNKDIIDCGDGGADIVHYDVGIDDISNCETLDGRAP